MSSADTLREALASARRGERTLVMGILNVTPDSFSDGGIHAGPSDAVREALRMEGEGADIVDVGGESTRPGARSVDADEECRRVLPVIEALVRQSAVPISIDTTKAEVAQRAVAAGATMVNDVSGATFDPAMRDTMAGLQVPVCLMHMRGTPRTMQDAPRYDDVVVEIRDWLASRADEAVRAGVARDDIVIDPGFGFGKTMAHNLEILRRLREFTDLGYPILVGTSRKSTIGAVLGGLPTDQRVEGTAATVAIAIANGAAIVRVHDVAAMARVVRMADAICRP